MSFSSRKQVDKRDACGLWMRREKLYTEMEMEEEVVKEEMRAWFLARGVRGR